jgi:hypothetical protein
LFVSPQYRLSVVLSAAALLLPPRVLIVASGTDLMRRRSGVCTTLEEKLFCLGIMGDERAVMET